MKVIGTTTDGYILQATNDEIAHLVGWYDFESMCGQLRRPVQIGDEIQISEMYRQLYGLVRYKDDIARIRQTLREYATKLELISTLRPLKNEPAKPNSPEINGMEVA